MTDSKVECLEDINEISEKELIRIIKNTPDGSYAFLIGAGASRPKPAEIPLADEMVEDFKEEIYSEENRDKKQDNWAKEYEKTHHKGDQSDYSFWFKKCCPNREARQTRITHLVDEAEPPLGQLILAKMMQDGIVSHVFTPNFDDLLVNASIDLPGRRPLFVDHDARASRIQFSLDRPAIIKLHGDYKHYTRNTDGETKELDENVRNAFQQSLQTHGLVVVGYGGTDESIMTVLNNTELSDKGLYWCKLINEDIDEDIDEKVKKLLSNNEEAHLVEIEGSEQLFAKFVNRVDEFELPEPDKFVERAEEIANQIEDLVEQKGMLDLKFRDEEYSQEEPSQETSLNLAGHETDREVSDKISQVTSAIEEENTEEAISILDELIEENGEFSLFYVSKGQLEKEIGQKKEAMESFNNAIDTDPENAKAYIERGTLHNDKNSYEDAIEDFTKALELDPENKRAYYNRASAKRSVGEIEGAIEDYTKTIEIDPENSDAYGARATAKADLGRYEEAVEDATKAIELNPENSDAYRVRGAAKNRMGEYEEAIKDTTQALNRNPENTAAYYNRGIAKARLGRDEEALEDLSEGIDLAPKDSDFYRLSSTIKVNLDRYEEAIEDATQAIELNPEEPNAYRSRAAAKANLGREKEAIEDATQAIDLGFEGSDAYRTRAAAKNDLERYEEAIEDATQAIEADPTDSHAYRIRGSSHLNLGQYQEALENYTEVIDLDVNNTVIYLERAEAYIALNNFDAVEEDVINAKERVSSDYEKTMCLLFELIYRLFKGEELNELEQEYMESCGKELDVTWDLQELRNVLEESELSDNKLNQIESWIEILSEKQEE